jgi:hypothetical protein
MAVSSAASAQGLPTGLHVVEAAGGAAYRSLGDGTIEVTVTVGERPHERVDALYDLVLALPLPIGFDSGQWRITPREGQAGASVPVVYAGERVALKRNTPLESSWLPLLVGAPDGLPDLSDGGYAWTFWDALLRYDPEAGDTVQGFGSFRYAADPSVPLPDPGDPRQAAFLISWIPTLDAAVPPFTLRLDVTEAAE